MKIKMKLRLMMMLVGLLPIVFMYILAGSLLQGNHTFNYVIALGLVFALGNGVLISSLMGRWLFLKEIARLSSFCAEVKKGNYNSISLPNQGWDNADENELVSLMRDMNWMVHTIKTREQQLTNTIAELDTAHEELRFQKEELEEANRNLAEMAMTDPLTHLHNRRHFFEHMEQEFSRLNRNSRTIGLLMMDIDHFKQVNDRHGHQSGDLVLVEFAAIIKKCIRLSDFISRIGGEEFTVLMPDTSREGVGILASRIRKAVEKYAFHNFLGNGIRISCSIGMCVIDQSHHILGDELLRLADNAMYMAKEHGRNCIYYYDVNENISKRLDESLL